MTPFATNRSYIYICIHIMLIYIIIHIYVICGIGNRCRVGACIPSMPMALGKSERWAT